jgi:hypothetical protein
MNDRPEQWDWPEPVQEMMSDEDFAMIVQEMAREPGHHEARARRIAAFEKLRQEILSRKSQPPEIEQPELPEPVQEMMSDEDFAMIVQEMVRTPGYEEGRARRLAAITELHEYLRNYQVFPADGLNFMRDDEDNEK